MTLSTAASQNVMRYKVWRSNKDKELHFIC
jgi:hypothetical protein